MLAVSINDGAYLWLDVYSFPARTALDSEKWMVYICCCLQPRFQPDTVCFPLFKLFVSDYLLQVWISVSLSCVHNSTHLRRTMTLRTWIFLLFLLREGGRQVRRIWYWYIFISMSIHIYIYIVSMNEWYGIYCFCLHLRFAKHIGCVWLCYGYVFFNAAGQPPNLSREISVIFPINNSCWWFPWSFPKISIWFSKVSLWFFKVSLWFSKVSLWFSKLPYDSLNFPMAL